MLFSLFHNALVHGQITICVPVSQHHNNTILIKSNDILDVALGSFLTIFYMLHIRKVIYKLYIHNMFCHFQQDKIDPCG